MDEPKPKHHHATLEFPKGFLWGAGTSAFQVEGNVKDSDWWGWEQKSQPENFRSGQAADQYNRYEQDFDLAKSLGHNAHRLSLEWSRIEPKEGEFDQTEIDHYIKALKYLKSLNIKIMLTLHHFSNPAWFAQKGGWLNPKSSSYFERFVKKIIPEIKDYVDLWITINEPGGYAYDAYGRGKFPPQVHGKVNMLRALWHLAQAHNKAYRIIHAVTPNAKVGIAHNVTSFNHFHHHSLTEAMAEWLSDILANHTIYYLTGKKTHDFLGLNYYFNSYISFNGQTRWPQMVDVAITKKDVSDMGWEIHPSGMFDVIMDFSDYHLPIYITENGVASTNDDRRVRFLINYLKEIYHALATGADVRGYFHWSLLDNYEWIEGFNSRFGLVDIDFKTQKRTPRPSAYVYKEIIRHNGIPHYLLKLLGHSLNVKEEIKLWPKEEK